MLLYSCPNGDPLRPARSPACLVSHSLSHVAPGHLSHPILPDDPYQTHGQVLDTNHSIEDGALFTVIYRHDGKSLSHLWFPPLIMIHRFFRALHGNGPETPETKKATPETKKSANSSRSNHRAFTHRRSVSSSRTDFDDDFTVGTPQRDDSKVFTSPAPRTPKNPSAPRTPVSGASGSPAPAKPKVLFSTPKSDKPRTDDEEDNFLYQFKKKSTKIGLTPATSASSSSSSSREPTKTPHAPPLCPLPKTSLFPPRLWIT